MADMEKYFIISHSGRAIPAVGLVAMPGPDIEVFSCRMCFALTMEPILHAEWHEEVTTDEQAQTSEAGPWEDE